MGNNRMKGRMYSSLLRYPPVTGPITLEERRNEGRPADGSADEKETAHEGDILAVGDFGLDGFADGNDSIHDSVNDTEDDGWLDVGAHAKEINDDNVH